MNPETGAIARFERRSDARKAGYTIPLSEPDVRLLVGLTRRKRIAAANRMQLQAKPASKPAPPHPTFECAMGTTIRHTRTGLTGKVISAGAEKDDTVAPPTHLRYLILKIDGKFQEVAESDFAYWHVVAGPITPVTTSRRRDILARRGHR